MCIYIYTHTIYTHYIYTYIYIHYIYIHIYIYISKWMHFLVLEPGSLRGRLMYRPPRSPWKRDSVVHLLRCTRCGRWRGGLQDMGNPHGTFWTSKTISVTPSIHHHAGSKAGETTSNIQEKLFQTNKVDKYIKSVCCLLWTLGESARLACWQWDWERLKETTWPAETHPKFFISPSSMC